MEFTTEREWQHLGYDCLIKRPNGAPGWGFMDLNNVLGPVGYVCIPKDHPWHGKSYTDAVADPDVSRLDGLLVKDQGAINAFVAAADPEDYSTRMESLVAVHGGLTFGGEMRGHDGWWIGFDCSHAGDTPAAWPTHRVANEVERIAEVVHKHA